MHSSFAYALQQCSKLHQALAMLVHDHAPPSTGGLRTPTKIAASRLFSHCISNVVVEHASSLKGDKKLPVLPTSIQSLAFESKGQTPPPESHSLEGFLRQSPPFFIKALPQNACKALMATSSGIREIFRCATTSIRVVRVVVELGMPELATACLKQTTHLQVGPNLMPTSWYLYNFWPALRNLHLNSMVLAHESTNALVSCSLPGLQKLSLTSCSISQAAAAELGKGSWPNLESLVLCNSQLSLQAMLDGCWPFLKRLDVSHAFPNTDQIAKNTNLEEELKHSFMPKLKYLIAEGWRCVCLSEIANKSRCPELKSLTVSRLRWEPNNTTVAGLQQLTLALDDAPSSLYILLSLHLPDLQSLQIQSTTKYTWLCNDGRFAHLAAKADWPQLQALKLSEHHLGVANSLFPIAQASCQKVQWLDLSLNQLDASAIQSLVACKLPCLTNLNLSANLLGHSAIGHLVQGQWPNLQQLDLSNNGFGVQGLHQDRGGRLACYVLVAAEVWGELGTLKLVGCHLDVGAFHIVFLGKWPKLKLLDVSSNDLPKLDPQTVMNISNNHTATCAFPDLLATWVQKQQRQYGTGALSCDYCVSLN